jgi:hypothetical protein
VTKEASKLQTKLRYVDIHNHWLRQEVSNGTIHVKYILTAEMLADSFTKALPANKWEEFLRQLGLVQRKDRGSVSLAALKEIQEQIKNMLLK